MKNRRLVSVVLATSLAGFGAAIVATSSPAVAAATTTRVSLTAAGAQSKGGSSDSPSMSNDGRFVAFSSTATNLVPGDTNAVSDVFVRDTTSGATTRVSVATNGTQADGASDSPVISGDGNSVAFHSVADNLAPNDTNHVDDVFLHNMTTGATSLVSVSSASGLGDGISDQPSISGDGRYVAFRSAADNLVTGDTLAKTDVFVRDTTGGTTERVSLSSAGGSPNGVSANPSISGDGRYVAFQSNGSNLTGTASAGKSQIYVRDRQLATNTALSIGTDSKPGNGNSQTPRISADGTTVVWTSAATNLVGAGVDTNGVTDIFERRLGTTTTTRLSVGPGGIQADGASQKPAIDADGGTVAFQSSATNLLGAGVDTNGVDDAFVVNQSSPNARASVSGSGAQGTGISTKPAISADGQQIAFRTNSAFDAADTNGAADIYLRDLALVPDLSVAMQVSDNPVSYGAQVTFTATVTNNGTGDATNVLVTMPRPAGTVSVGATAPDGCTLDSTGATCNIQPLSAGQSAPVTFTVENQTVSQATVTETATADPSGQTDRNPADNSASVSTTLLAAGETTTHVNRTQYLQDNNHSSFEPAATAITPANAGSLTKRWTWKPDAGAAGEPGPNLEATPAVVDGTIYEGSNHGDMYAIDEATGTTKWKRALGFTPRFLCSPFGIVASATVLKDPVTGVLTVYVAAGDNAVYALDAATGNTIWREQVVPQQTTSNNYYMWSSPTVRGNDVYIGLASQCDSPLVRGGVARLDRETGQIEALFWNVPSGKIGASVVSTTAAPLDGSNAVYETTGNVYPANINQPWFQASFVRLDGSDLSLVDHWEIPPAQQNGDSDFISSPVLWSGVDSHGVTRNMVGACNKNGVFYALDRDHLSAGPVWQMTVGRSDTDPDACIATASTDGHLLYVPSDETMLNGTDYLGAVRAVDPMTGTVVWQHGFIANVLSAPTINGSGVLGVEEFSYTNPNSQSLYLLNAATGATLIKENVQQAFGQPVFADGYVFYTTVSKGLIAYSPSAP